jgi:hypothetical protein
MEVLGPYLVNQLMLKKPMKVRNTLYHDATILIETTVFKKFGIKIVLKRHC